MSIARTPGVDGVERARRMARHRAAKRRAASPQLQLPGMDDAENENARLQPGANQPQIKEDFSNGLYR